MRQRGFSLIEVMVVVALVAAVTLAAVANHYRIQPQYILEKAAGMLISDLRMARMLALSHNTDVTFEMEEDGRGYSIEMTVPSNAPPTGAETIVRQLDGRCGLSVHGPEASGVFGSRGEFRTSVSAWRIRLAVPREDARWVHVLPGGQIKTTRGDEDEDL